MTEREVRLGPQDSAIIFRADGSQELHVPNGKPDDIVPPSAELCLHVAIMLHDPEVLAAVHARLEKEREKPQ